MTCFHTLTYFASRSLWLNHNAHQNAMISNGAVDSQSYLLHVLMVVYVQLIPLMNTPWSYDNTVPRSLPLHVLVRVPSSTSEWPPLTAAYQMTSRAHILANESLQLPVPNLYGFLQNTKEDISEKCQEGPYFHLMDKNCSLKYHLKEGFNRRNSLQS